MWEPIVEKWSFGLDFEFGTANNYKKKIDLLAEKQTLNIDISEEMVI